MEKNQYKANNPESSACIEIHYSIKTTSYEANLFRIGLFASGVDSEYIPSVLYTIDESQVNDFIQKLNLYVSEHQGTMPVSENKKSSEYLELSCIRLYRLDSSTFAVFNRYYRPISGIFGIDIEFKKREV